MTQLKRFQKHLRAMQTDAESILWYHLKNRRLQGYKFRRQHCLQGYIVDFVCLENKVVVELDGGQHTEQQAYDTIRTQTLEREGFFVLRFWNHELLANREEVLEVILQALKKFTPHPLAQKARDRPLPQGERGQITTFLLNFYFRLSTHT